MNWGWIVGAVVVFLTSAIYQRLYKKQDEHVAHLKRRIHRQQIMLVAARQLNQVVLDAVPTIGQAMVKLHSEPLSIEIEKHYNALRLRAGEFRVAVEGKRRE